MNNPLATHQQPGARTCTVPVPPLNKEEEAHAMTDPQGDEDFEEIELNGRWGSEPVTTLHGDAPCFDCGSNENIRWWTDNVFWNAVCPDHSPILCIMCFARRAEATGFRPRAWRVIPEFDWVRIEGS